MTTNKSALGDWSTTNASNGTVDGANVAENCPMSGLNDAIRGLAAGAKGALTYVATAGTDTYTATMAPVPDGYATDTVVLINFGNANTSTTPTLNLNSLGAKTITDHEGSALQAGVLAGRQLLVYDGVNFRVALKTRQQTRQVLTSGTGATYTTPTGATRINVRMVGGGGGGGGATANNGSNGTNTTFSTLTAGLGGGGVAAGTPGGGGGAATGGDINIAGGAGQSAVANGGANTYGGYGGTSIFGGAGQNQAATTGGSGGTNTGAGGAGGGNGAGASVGSGGGAGAYCEKLIVAPAATYTYTVGAGGNGGAAGGNAGGNGGSGIIIVDEYYN